MAYRIVDPTSGSYSTGWTSTSGAFDSVIVAYAGSTLKDPIGRGIIQVPRAYLDRPPTVQDVLRAWFGRITSYVG